MTGVIGLAFIGPEAVKIALNNKKWTAEIYPAESFGRWYKTDHGKRSRVVLLTDKSRFQEALTLDVEKIIACCPWSWLEARGIETLDARRKGDGLVIQNNIKPSTIQHALVEVRDYKPSVNDRWLRRGAPKPARENRADKSYHTYSLANLVHIALNRADETLLLIKPKDFWISSYHLATGKISRKAWLARYGRSLISAGTSREDLQNITLWVKKYGRFLIEKKKKKPISKLDLKLAKKLGETSLPAT